MLIGSYQLSGPWSGKSRSSCDNEPASWQRGSRSTTSPIRRSARARLGDRCMGTQHV